VVFLDELPRNATGKVLKRDLAEEGGEGGQDEEGDSGEAKGGAEGKDGAEAKGGDDDGEAKGAKKQEEKAAT
jgi:hypothetical protein